MLTKDINIKLGSYLIIGFVLFTVIGTVSHELGHYSAAKLLGYEARINYGSTFFGHGVNRQDSFIIRLCGPLQTVCTGTIGFLLLLYNKKAFYSSSELNFKKWIIVFVSLFWLREVFNFLHDFIRFLTDAGFSSGNDEVRLTEYLNINKWSITLPAAVIASLLLMIIVFKFIPAKQRLTFLISGLFGGFLGFYLWLNLLGPIVMP
jgi:hypothetical protein